VRKSAATLLHLLSLSLLPPLHFLSRSRLRTQRQHPPMAAGEVVRRRREALWRCACSPRGRARHRRTVLRQCPFSRSRKIACSGVAATSDGSGPSRAPVMKTIGGDDGMAGPQVGSPFSIPFISLGLGFILLSRFKSVTFSLISFFLLDL
jgi:hypothetical protein